MGEYVVGKIILPYNPRRLFNKRNYKRARYAKIASEEGKKKAIEILEKDYNDGLLPYPTYRDIRKFLIHDVKEVEETPKSEKLLKILEFMVTHKTRKVKDISKSLNIDEEEVLEVYRWGKKQYSHLANVVVNYVKQGTT